MASSYQIFMGGPVNAEFYSRITTLEVEENADLPGALQMRLPLARSAEGDLTEINEAGIQPLAPIAVVATAEGKPPECIFDGYVLSHKLHVESGVTGAWVEVYAQDAAWLMNLEEKTREWANTTDGLVANSIFGEYGVTPSPDNLNDDSPTHTEDGHTLMQRATDIEFLRMLARRSGKLCRVAGGLAPGAPVGVFARPKLDTSPVANLRPNDPEAPNIRSLDIEWDVMRPTSVRARQALFTDDAADGARADTDASG
ncbi:MAG: hypothetical protein JNL62_26135, partial [Bryobacterales bacterium]|nr:hypothetical protein [Bryobacterales bacterium]